ncbi:MAG: FAD-linked oxidase C-terminal domain-containing protein [Pseudomonadota bacterium]
MPRKVRRSLQHIFAATDLLLDASDCLVYGYDNSRRQAQPTAVCFAQNAEQIIALVQLCRTHQIPLIPRGAGTGTTGATVPEQGGIILSTERFRHTLQIDPDNRLAVVSPGFTNQELQQQAAQHGFFWPPDPGSASICTVGGNLAHNSAGPRAIKYGTPRDNTLGLRAVSGRGELLRTGVRTSKGVVGYDLTRLLIGSEGTLAITTEATLRLTPLPEAKRTLQAVYRSVAAAAQAVSALMAQPVTPCVLEFMDGQAIRMVRDYADLDLPDEAAALLLIEVDGTTDGITQAAQQVQQVAQNADCIRILLAESDTEKQHLWRARKALSPSLRHVAPKKINEDVAVPVSRLPTLIDGLQQLSAEHGITIVNFGHAGNGNIHVNLLFDPDNPAQAAASEPCLLAVFELVLRLGGTLSGEHGVGRAKRPYVGRELDQHALTLMRLIKEQFDPDGILNPGVGIPAPD